MNSIFHRISVRKFEDRPVEQEKLDKILRAGMQAPSAMNQQPWEFYVVTNKETIQKLSETSPYSKSAAGAPVIIVPAFRKEGLPVQALATVDMSISLENIWLETDELGLGGVWMAVHPDPERVGAVREILGMPENLEPFALFPMGYPAESRAQQDRYDESRIHFVN